jgi:hypothetical protein
MKNKLSDLNNHLFSQLERLNEEDLDEASIEKEIKRTDCIIKISTQIIEGANVSLRAAKLVSEYGGDINKFLPETTNDICLHPIDHKNRKAM